MRRAVMLSLALLGACASEPQQMYMEPTPQSAKADSTTPTWPALPEIPRYAYAGQLLGEANFRAAENARPSRATRALRWLVGLGAGNGREPVHLNRPQSGTVDAHGRVLVTDVGQGAVFVFDEVGAQLRVWTEASAQEELRAPIGIASGAQDTVLVADAELARIIVLDSEGHPQRSFGGEVLKRPTGLARDAVNGRIYVADTGSHDIKVFDDGGTLVTVIGRRGEGAGEFNAPTHLAIANGQLYVSDTLNARIQVLGLDGAPRAMLGRRGLFLGNMNRPKGVAADDEGNVYVIESYYDHLLVFDAEGQFLLPIGGSGAGIGQFFLPAGVWLDQRGRIFVADMYNQRVVIFNFLGG